MLKQMIKNAIFGLFHAFLYMGSIAAVILTSMFWLAKPVGDYLIQGGYNPWFAAISATACVIGPIVVFAVYVLYPWQNWLEDELRRRERLTCKICRAKRAAA